MFSVLVVVFPLLGQPTPESITKLWAGITVQQPVFGQTEIGKLTVSFAVVNDSTSTANPDVESSHLFINGMEPENWGNIIINGLRSPEFRSLPPGRTLTFGYALGTLFTKPGIYTLRWEGANFKSADLVFRVVAVK